MGVKNGRVFMSSQNDLYLTPDARANTVFDPGSELYKIRNCLKKSKDYWTTEIYQEPSPMNVYNMEFYAWLTEEYGLDVQFEETYGVNGLTGYTVIDEQKFLMFMLKFQ